MSVGDFVSDLELVLAAEQVGENPELPADFAPFAHHYRLEIFRAEPPMLEHFIFSVPATAVRPARPDPLDCLIFMAQTINDYRDNPEPEAWAASKGLSDYLPGIREQFHTFARDEAKLERLFGESMERFLALDPRRA